MLRNLTDMREWFVQEFKLSLEDLVWSRGGTRVSPTFRLVAVLPKYR